MAYFYYYYFYYYGITTTAGQCVAPIHCFYSARHSLLITGGPFYRPKNTSCQASCLVALLLLFAGVEPNPGPPATFGFINARPIVRRATLICDMIATHNLDVLAVAETWIRDDDSDAI